jgi:hypothetical protein
MYADGTLERFDELEALQAYPGLFNLEDRSTGKIAPQKLGGRATLEDFYYFVEETLRTYQSYWVPEEKGDDWRGFMPYAFLLEPGMKLLNRDTKTLYTISEVTKNPFTHRPTGEVRLSGDTAPELGDVLELEEKDRIKFSRVSPRSDETDHEADATRKDTPLPWNAHIDFAVVEEAPAEAKPGSARPITLGKKRMLRETIDGVEPGIEYEIRGQWLDSIVRFDLWGATESQAESLVYWFYQYLRQNAWIFKLNGVSDVSFLKRGMDQPIGKWRGILYHRAIDLFVRTEHLFVAQYRKLEHITLYIQKKQDRVLEEAQSPTTGKPVFRGADPSVTFTPTES